MRHWLYTPAKTATIGPSTALSLAAHIALVGAAVYGTGVRARALQEEISQRTEFIPPPDRRPAAESRRELLMYVEVGGGTVVAAPAVATGTETASTSLSERTSIGGTPGRDAVADDGSALVASEDSVYSVLDVEESAVRADDSAAPVYPYAMVLQRKDGEVMMRYVVDTTGRVDMAESHVLSATNREFVESVRDVLPLMRFIPAMVQGRRVRQLVEQTFTFRITLPPPISADQSRAQLRHP